MSKKCWKCGSKKKITRHHIYGKKGLCGLKYDSELHLMVFLTWLGVEWDAVDIMFWEDKIAHICRDCHDEFHILFTKLINKCDSMQSEDPIRKYLEDSKCLTNGIMKQI